MRRSLLERIFDRLTAKHIYKVLPRGVELQHDILKALPRFDAKVVFDVGANVGQSARAFLSMFPNAHIYSFEPVQATYSQLRRNLDGVERAHCLRMALGSSKFHGKMSVTGSSEMFTLIKDQEELSNKATSDQEDVEVVPLDAFCKEGGIEHVDFLKVDTEGGDLDVIKGADFMLSSQSIDMIQLEAGMNSGNNWHVPFETLRSYMEAREYYLFGIYEQFSEWPTRLPHLRRTNPVYISRRVTEANRA